MLTSDGLYDVKLSVESFKTNVSQVSSKPQRTFVDMTTCFSCGERGHVARKYGTRVN